MLITATVAAGVPFWLTAAAATVLLLCGAGMLLIWLVSRSRR
jgi:hypothetical protein